MQKEGAPIFVAEVGPGGRQVGVGEFKTQTSSGKADVELKVLILKCLPGQRALPLARRQIYRGAQAC
jgi:hypothetical protein